MTNQPTEPTGQTEPTIQRLAELQQFIADFAKVERMINLADTGRPENDVEHSYGLALTCWFLAPKIAPELDLGKILQYALAHDTVEVHAGDTFIFGDQQAIDSKSDREDAAIQSLARDWPDFPELTDHARGYKDKRDQEALFVYAVDKMLPVLNINLGEAADYYAHHKITAEMMAEKKKNMLVSPIVAPYYDRLVYWLTHPDYFYKPEPADVPAANKA